MDKKLFASALIKFFFGALIVGALIFLPAGTLKYPGGILLMAVLFIPMFFAGIVMMIKNPDLLRRRLNNKEEQSEQKAVIALSAVMFIAGFVIAGLDFRFSWLPLPEWVRYASAGVFLVAYAIYAEVLRENTYLSRVIEVTEGQKVIDTGLYSVVRHPMYGATVLLFLSMPLMLGSLIAFAVFLMYPFIIAKRIKNEEQVLEKELAGYSEYKKKVKYRMLPLIW